MALLTYKQHLLSSEHSPQSMETHKQHEIVGGVQDGLESNLFSPGCAHSALLGRVNVAYITFLTEVSRHVTEYTK